MMTNSLLKIVTLFWMGGIISGGFLSAQLSQQEQSLFALRGIEMTFGDSDALLPSSSDQGLSLSYEVLTEGVVTLSNENMLSIMNAGTTSLRAYNDGDQKYLPFEKTVTVKVFKAYQTANSVVYPIVLRYGDEPYPLVMQTDQHLPLSYTSSADGIVDIVNGTVSIVHAGIVILTLTNDGDNNYNPFQMNTLVQIDKGTLTVYPPNHEMIYGDTLPTLTIASIQGFEYNDSWDDITLPRLSTVGECMPVGEYPITAMGGSSPDYNFVYQTGVLTIKKASLDVFVSPITREYAEPNPPLNIYYEGFKCADDASVVQNMTAVTNADQFSQGSYGTSINPTYFYYYLKPETSLATAQNYYFIPHLDTLTVTKAPLQVKPDSISFLYGDFDADRLTKTLKGFKFNDYEYSKVSFDLRPYFVTDATATSPVGIYPLSCMGGISRNYELSYAPADTIRIRKAPLYLTAQSAEKEYGQENPPLDFIATGFKNNEDSSVLYSYPTVQTTADLRSSVGTYPTYVLPTDAQNYYMVYQEGELTVHKAPLTLVIDSAFREPLTLNPDFVCSSLGWKFPEDSISVIEDQIRLWSDAIFLSAEGSYPIHADTQEVENYLCSYQPGTLVVRFEEKDLSTDRSYRFYPGVVSSCLHIDGITGDEKVLIYNKDGALKDVFENGQGLLNLSSYRQGIYIVQIVSQNQSFIQRIIKQ